MRHKKICDCCSLTKDLSKQTFLHNPNAPVNNLVKQIHIIGLLAIIANVKRKYQQEYSSMYILILQTCNLTIDHQNTNDVYVQLHSCDDKKNIPELDKHFMGFM